MSSPLQNRIEQAYAEFQEQKRAISGFTRQMAEARTTVTAKSRTVSATVDGRGDLVEIKFLTNAYRSMAPAELGSLLVETVRAARDQARGDAAELFRTMLPAGLPVLDMLNGSVDFDAMLRDTVRMVNEPVPGTRSGEAKEER